MKSRSLKHHFPKLVLMAAMPLLLVGCPDQKKTSQPPQPAASKTKTKTEEPLVPKRQVADWCKEHGVPESICTRCNEALVPKYKDKGDWCKKHGLPDTQCFTCHPELEKEFLKKKPKTGS